MQDFAAHRMGSHLRCTHSQGISSLFLLLGFGLPHSSLEHQLAGSPDCNKCNILGVVGLVYSPARKRRRFMGEDPPFNTHCHFMMICRSQGQWLLSLSCIYECHMAMCVSM